MTLETDYSLIPILRQLFFQSPSTPTLAGNRTSKIKFFDVKEFFRMNLDLKNGCKNEF